MASGRSCLNIRLSVNLISSMELGFQELKSLTIFMTSLYFQTFFLHQLYLVSCYVIKRKAVIMEAIYIIAMALLVAGGLLCGSLCSYKSRCGYSIAVIKNER